MYVSKAVVYFVDHYIFFSDRISYLKKMIFKAGIKSDSITGRQWFPAFAAHWNQWGALKNSEVWF